MRESAPPARPRNGPASPLPERPQDATGRPPPRCIWACSSGWIKAGLSRSTPPRPRANTRRRRRRDRTAFVRGDSFELFRKCRSAPDGLRTTPIATWRRWRAAPGKRRDRQREGRGRRRRVRRCARRCNVLAPRRRVRGRRRDRSKQPEDQPRRRRRTEPFAGPVGDADRSANDSVRRRGPPARYVGDAGAQRAAESARGRRSAGLGAQRRHPSSTLRPSEDPPSGRTSGLPSRPWCSIRWVSCSAGFGSPRHGQGKSPLPRNRRRPGLRMR